MKKLFMMLVAVAALASFSLTSCAGKDAKDSTSKSGKPTVESVKTDLMKIVDDAKTPEEMKAKAEEYMMKLMKNEELAKKVEEAGVFEELEKYAEKKFPNINDVPEEVEEAAEVAEAMPEAVAAPEEAPAPAK